MKERLIQLLASANSGQITPICEERIGINLALLVGDVQTERFCDGVLNDFFKVGSICEWLKRLQRDR